jgi:hypothetical protein
MLLSVHGAYSNDLPREVYRNSSLQFPAGIGGNKSIQILHTVLIAPDERV